jgi:PAS domain S-box-containing protein
MAKILIIDDSPVNRRFLTTLLGYEHHDLREASDGVEGLRVARDQRSDLIISDVLMPTMDGYEFVRRLREDVNIGKTPVIFSTAHYLSRESNALAKKCGVTSIIYKPCEPQAVLDLVAAALGEPPTQLPAALRQPEEFDREHLRLVTDKVSEKADELRDAHERLTALIELSTDLAQERDPVQLLNRICSVAREIIGARWTMVVLLEPNRKMVQHLGVAGIQLQDSPALRSALLKNGVFKTVTEEGRTICLSDVTSTPLALQLPQSLPRAASLLVAPLVMRGHVDGWICLADKLGLDAFSEDDEQLAPALAAQMAVAYANARLYRDSLQYATKLEQEIAQRAGVERQLGDSRAQLAGIIGSAMDSIITVDTDQRIVMFNTAAETMFRCPSAEVIGQPLDRFIPKRFRRSHSQDIRAFAGTSVTTRAMAATRPVSGVRADGEEFPVEASISQIEVGGRKLYTVIMRDIGEQVRSLEALRASELRYRRLFESAKDGILILAANSGQILEVNPFLLDMLGYAKEELIGKELWQLGLFTDVLDSKAAFTELQQQGYIRYEDLPLKSRDGVIKQVEFVSNTYLVDGSSVIQCNIRDITARKWSEKVLAETNRRLESTLSELSSTTEQLWQASKLATMGELSASIAHELNNPLATIALRVETLLMPMTSDDPNRRSLEIITQEVDRMARLIDNLLQFSRRSHRQISTVDVREEIINSVEFVQYHLRTKKIEVVYEFADSVPTIQADRQQLRQLFLNLLTNASDAMPKGGQLVVRVKSVDIEDSEAVEIEFADSGEGITPENLEQIWEPFFTTKPEGKGTGLGLAICRRIVEEHGGPIAIESKAGVGTTVRMVFPATTNPEPVDSQ